MSFNVNLDTLYRQVIMDHYKNPRNKGVLNDSIVVDMNNPTCGDRIRLTMKIEDEKVIDAKFEGEGCSISMASASMMTQAIKGKDIETALKMSHVQHYPGRRLKKAHLPKITANHKIGVKMDG